MGILNRWRQFGRRYFWSHLLLGVVAANIGAPISLNGLPQQISLSTAFANINRISPAVPGIGALSLSNEVNSRPLQNLNSWQHFAIRNYLTRLAVSFTSNDETAPEIIKAEAEGNESLNVNHHALLDSLSIQSAVDLNLSSAALHFVSIDSIYTLHPVRTWLSKVQGIRAGPSLFQ